MGLGIRKVEWHPTGDWIAVGGWDGKVSERRRRLRALTEVGEGQN